MAAMPKVRMTREQMEKRVARFADLKGYDTGLPDSYYPGARRTLYGIVSAPLTATPEGLVPPGGVDAQANPGIQAADGFLFGLIKTTPGQAYQAMRWSNS